MQKLIHAAEQISLFCRININTKRDLPIRSSEMGLLIYLVKADGEKTPMGVSRFFKVTKAMATNMVSSLAKQGYLTKQQSNEDRRSIVLMPTGQAVDLVESTYTEYYKTMALLEKKMGESEFLTLIHLLERANTVLLEDKSNG